MKCRGFILLTIMAFLLLSSLLVCGVMEITLLQNKLVTHQWQFWQRYMSTVNANQSVCQTLLKHQKLMCFGKYSAEDRYWKQDNTTWQTLSCTNQYLAYHSQTVIEKLPDTFCYQSTLFFLYRVTTQTQSNQEKILRTQSTLLVPVNNSPGKKITCTVSLSQLSSSLQSFRIE